MKVNHCKRGLAMLLSLLMVVGLFTVSGFGVLAEGTKALSVKTWDASELAAAATEKGTKNSHDYPIFTTYSQCIGRRSLNTSNYFIFGARVEHLKDGELQYYNGLSAIMIVRLIADEGYMDGNLCSFDVAYKVNEYGDQFKQEFVVDLDAYEAAPLQTDPVYGYDYKEFSMMVDFNDEVYNDEADNSMELRVISRNDQFSTTVFSIELISAEDDAVLAKYEGEQLAGINGIDGTYENVYADESIPAGVVSYAGPDDPALASRGEPYSLYNCDGQKALDFPGAILMDSLGMELPAGDYSMDFNMSTMYSLGEKKVTYYVMDGEEELAKLYVDVNMVDATVGRDSGAFEIRSVPFTIDESHAGHLITFKVEIYNQTDYKLQSVQLNMLVDEDAQAPAEAQSVIDAIANLKITDTAAIEAARKAYEDLDLIGKAWVENIATLESYEQANASAKGVIDAITALGAASDVNKDNYTDKTGALEEAERLYNTFLAQYGDENTAALITNAQALTDFRTAYDAAEAEAEEAKKQAAIDNVESLIEAIGEVTEDNYTEKGSRIEAAEAALATLRSDYGNEIDSEVSNLTALTDARAKYDEYSAEPDVTYGDVNNDGKIDASDALEALQHSVELKKLEGDAFTAADVTNDGTVDATDALNILQYSVELIDHFPVEEK